MKTNPQKCKTCKKDLIKDWHEGNCIKCSRDKVLGERNMSQNTISEIMENLSQGVVGEDGLTIFDFADLRDALTQLENHIREEERDRIRMLFEIKPSSQSWHEAVENALSQPNNKQLCSCCANTGSKKHYVNNKQQKESIEKRMLRQMLDWDDEYSYGYDHFEGIERKELKKNMAELRNSGLVKMYRGGLNDDGEVVGGTGFAIVYQKRREIMELLNIKETL